MLSVAANSRISSSVRVVAIGVRSLSKKIMSVGKILISIRLFDVGRIPAPG